MKSRTLLAITLLACVALAIAAASSPALAKNDLAKIKTVDANTPKDIQIRLALSAGPPIADKAAVYIIGPRGYELARKGSNGFTCVVDRQPINSLAPECFDAEGMDTTLKARFFVEEQRAKKVAEAEIDKQVEDGYRSKRFIAPRKPGIVYMLSEHNYLQDPSTKKIAHFPGHLMFYAPYFTEKEVGSGPGAPYLTNAGKADNLMVVVPAPHHQ